MRGRHRRGIAVGAVAGTAALFGCLTMPPALAASGHASVSGNVAPIVECTAKHGGVNHSVFGYRNSGATTVISVGAQNHFAPGVPDRSQPTTFESGTHINVFSVTSSASLTWTLDGQQVHAPNVVCQTAPTSSTLAGWGPIGAIVIVTLLLGSLLFRHSMRSRAHT